MMPQLPDVPWPVLLALPAPRPGFDEEAGMFEVRREEPLRTTRDRLFQVEFVQTPGEELQRRVATAFEIWSELLILGGYAPPEQDPRLVHTLPDFAYWSDDVTFVQPFEESVESDEAAFDATVGSAARLHRPGTAVRSVTIV